MQPNSGWHQSSTRLPTCSSGKETGVSDDYLSAKDNRLQYPPDKRRDYPETQLKLPPWEICAHCRGRSHAACKLPMKNEGGRLTLSTTRRLPSTKLGLFARSRWLGNYLLDPLLPSNHQMQINKSDGIILAITQRKMTKIKRRQHSWCHNPHGGTVQSIFHFRYSIYKCGEEMKTT